MDEWIHTTCAPSGLGRGWARVSTRLAASLETTHRETFEACARDTKLGREELTSDVPHADLDHLDPATGLAREGTAVKPGVILIGKVSPKGEGAPLNPEEQLLRSIFGERASQVRDTSLRAPPGVRGVVVAARREAPVERGEVARASVTVEWTRPLAVGDALEIEGRGEVVVCAIDPSADALAVDGVHGEARVAKRALAEEMLHMRSIGPYSLVSQQPLGGKRQFGGQRMAEHQLRALVGAGAPWTAGECLTIKSDDVHGRIRAYESLVSGKPLQPYPSGATVEAAPSPWVQIESAKVLRAEALALNFEIGWDEGRASARWLGPRAILERSSGEVKNAYTMNYRTFEPEPDGLFCARIFGPVRDYECLCGKYRLLKDRGTICERCGVEVIASSVRRERFGHVALAVPVLHPWLVEPIARLLGLGEAEVRERGGPAVRELLEAVDLGALADERSPRGALARALRAARLAPIDLVVTVVPVLPPDLRPLVPLEGGRVATSDLNELYRRLIHRNNRTRRLIELDGPAIIIDQEVRKLEEAYAQLLQNMNERNKVTGPNKQPLRCLASSFAARGGQNLVGKRVDYSGCAQLVVDGALGERECRLPHTMALELFKPHLYSAIYGAGHATTIKAAKRKVEAIMEALYGCGPREPEARPSLDRPVDELELSAGPAQVLGLLERIVAGHPVVLAGTERVLCREATLWDHPAVAVSPATANLLTDRAIAVHVPLTEEAKAECARLPDLAAPVERAASGWLTAILFGAAGPQALVQAAIEGEVDPLTDPVARLALGLPPPVLETRSA